jgi:2-keto-4-pentenoate hydratase
MRSRNGLVAGEVISTGTCSGFYRAGPDDTVRADFGRLGAVDLRFKA